MTLPEAIESVRPSIVQISAAVYTNVQPEQVHVPDAIVPLGTGFIVNTDGYVITADHVVKGLQSIQNVASKKLRIGVAFANLDSKAPGGGAIKIRGNFTNIDCDIIEEDTRHDIALLKMRRNPFAGELPAFSFPGGVVEPLHKVAALSPDKLSDGEAIAVSGYPLRSTVLVTTSGSVASAWVTEFEDVQLPDARPRIYALDSYLADIHVNHGNSGGPVYSVERGTVIGICVSFYEAPVEGTNRENESLYYNSGLAKVIPIGYVIDLLKKNNLKWTEQSTAGGTLKGN